jgi:class 3 adenylate cyclase
MRRFPLRMKIAGFAVGLVVLATGLVALFTVILPWRAKLRQQERLASSLATPLGLGIGLSADGKFHLDPSRVHQLVRNSSRIPGVEILYALLWDEKGNLDINASSVNEDLLRKEQGGLLQLYLRDPAECYEVLASGKTRPGIRRLHIRLTACKVEAGVGERNQDCPQNQQVAIGRLDLGLSTVAINQELQRSLQRDAVVLVLTLLLGLLGALMIARRIAQPLTDLSAAMGRLREGDFDVQATSLKQSNDEVGDLARAFDSMTAGLKERERLRGTLGRYVSDPVAKRILSEESDLHLRGEVRHVAVLFLDVRGFTTMSERLTPSEVVALLNEYFDVVVDRVTANGGSVNKFIGDAAMCIWGAPSAVPEPEKAAVACALQIQEAGARLSADRIRRGLTSVAFGIGINAGEAVAGNLGAARRLEYTVIGDAVNLAQRLESQARPGEVLISAAVHEKVEGWVLAVPREPVKLKGKSQPVPLWEVKAVKAAEAA